MGCTDSLSGPVLEKLIMLHQGFQNKDALEIGNVHRSRCRWREYTGWLVEAMRTYQEAYLLMIFATIGTF